MNFFLKLFLLFVAITLVFILTYEMTGQNLEYLFSQDKCIEWFYRIKPVAWILGIFLLISDILLPIPATGIMAALGTVYGLWFGTLISVTGSVGAGLIGYGMARILGRNASRWIASEQEIQKFKDVFDRWGGYAIMASRAMPVMPEVMTILAGLGKMKFSRFIIALVAGSFPVAFFFSWMGACSGLPPGMGVMVAVLLPVLFWPILAKMNKI